MLVSYVPHLPFSFIFDDDDDDGEDNDDNDNDDDDLQWRAHSSGLKPPTSHVRIYLFSSPHVLFLLNQRYLCWILWKPHLFETFMHPAIISHSMENTLVRWFTVPTIFMVIFQFANCNKLPVAIDPEKNHQSDSFIILHTHTSFLHIPILDC